MGELIHEAGDDCVATAEWLEVELKEVGFAEPPAATCLLTLQLHGLFYEREMLEFLKSQPPRRWLEAQYRIVLGRVDAPLDAIGFCAWGAPMWRWWGSSKQHLMAGSVCDALRRSKEAVDRRAQAAAASGKAATNGRPKLHGLSPELGSRPKRPRSKAKAR